MPRFGHGPLSHAAIGRKLGHTSSCVRKWLKPDKAKESYHRENNKPGRRAQKRAWEHQARASCPRCQRPMRVGSACPSKRPGLCKQCRDAYAQRPVAAVDPGRSCPRSAEEDERCDAQQDRSCQA